MFKLKNNKFQQLILIFHELLSPSCAFLSPAVSLAGPLPPGPGPGPRGRREGSGRHGGVQHCTGPRPLPRSYAGLPRCVGGGQMGLVIICLYFLYGTYYVALTPPYRWLLGGPLGIHYSYSAPFLPWTALYCIIRHVRTLQFKARFSYDCRHAVPPAWYRSRLGPGS